MQKRHAQEVSESDSALDAVKKRIAEMGAGLDSEKVCLAETVISVRGDVFQAVHGQYSDQDRSGVRAKAVSDAMAIIADGGEKLRCEYIGVKNYEHFGDQREDHRYGMGPRHGSIVFSISLRVRDRELKTDEIEAALYYLNALPEIQKARRQAA